MRVLLVVYDNGGFTHLFPMGLGYIAAALEKIGVDIEVWCQDMHHWPDEQLTRHLDENRYDVVGISLIAGYYQYRKLLSLSEAINRSRQRPLYVIGGYGPTPEPEFFLGKTGADVIVMGEGEETVVELMQAVAAKRPLLGIPGLAFQEGNQVVINPRRPLIADIDSIAWPAYGRFPIDYYRLVRMPRMADQDFAMPLMSGRGCTFRCTFCYRMDPGYRPRDPDDIVEEIRYLNRDWGITFITFQDDLLMASVEQTEAIARALLRADLGVTWNCNGRLNYTTPDLLRLMRDAGCVYINYGIESLDEEVLKGMKKGLSPEMVVKGVEATLEVGISPGLNMIFGSIGDTPETLRQAVDFLIKYDDCCEIRTIRPVTPYPGSPLYYDAIEKGLLEGPEDFYENKHLNADLLAVNFTELSDDRFYACLQDANRRLLENYHQTQRQASLDQVAQLYETRDTSFRGFRPV